MSMKANHRFDRVFLTSSSLILVLSLSACGGGSSGGGVVSTPPPVVVAPTPTPVPVPTPTPTPTVDFNTTEYQRSNAAVQAKAISAYQAGATGAGVIVAVIDSGINQSSDEFVGRISAASADVAGNSSVQDIDGHGTAVSSVLLGAKNDTNTHGVAFNATLVALRADSPGTCADTSANGGCDFNDNSIARGVDRAIVAGARVINISLGGSPSNAALLAALDRATAAGIVLVFSGGNDGVENPTLAQNPDAIADIGKTAAARGLVLAVGSVGSNHILSDFSNKAGNGASYFITALGAGVRAPGHTGANFLWSGTSFSAPVVSGAVALLAQAFPNLTGAQIVDLLKHTADDLGSAGVDNIYGNGELNLARAFQPQGAATLAGSKIPISYVNNGMTSAPMGDAAGKGLSAVIRDRYGRAFNTELSGTFSRAPISAKLGAALDHSAQARAGGFGPVGVSLAISGQPEFARFDQLGLASGDRDRARALAGAIVLRLSKSTKMAFGVAHRGQSLVSDLQLKRGASFLVAEAGRDTIGFFNKPDMAFALRQAFGKTGLSVSMERGQARLWNDNSSQLRAGRYQDHATRQMSVAVDRRFGPISADVALTRLEEHDAILGARLGALTANTGAVSWFGDANTRMELGRNWAITGSFRRGATRVGAGGLHTRTDWLNSNAWSADINRSALLQSGDSLSLRVSQPLRISSGGLGLNLPTGYDYASGQTSFGLTNFALSPTGRERVIEAAYRLKLLGGVMSANGYLRKEPGNVELAPNDLGLAIRFACGF